MVACKCMRQQIDERYEKVDKLIAKYKGKKGPLIPVLHGSQQIFGYLPEDLLKYIAQGLKIPYAEVYGVVTFYSFFNLEPKGDYTVGVCLGTACYVRGAQQVLDEIKEQLDIDVGETTPDKKFTLGATRCVGACGLAPVVTIGDDVYGRMTSDKVKDILSKY